MKQYIDIVNRVLDYGEEKIGRNGKTISVTGETFRHDMRKGFPILTIRQMSLTHAITETRFFIQGLTDKTWLQARGNHFWDKWHNPKSNDTNDLGPIYGKQWRNFAGVDQLKSVLDTLRKSPLSRRMLVSAWNVGELESMALPPCHDSFQLISNGKDLDLIWRQRSCDIAVGLPYDILLYGLLHTLIAKEVNMTPRWLVGQLGDTHVYEQNLEQLKKVIERRPHLLPELSINRDCETYTDIFEWAVSDERAKDYALTNYKYHPKERFEAVE